MSTAPEKVFPPAAPAGPAPAPAGPRARGGLKLNKQTAMIGGAAVVVVLGLVASARSEDSDDAEASGEAGYEPYELDTRDTDIYNELQPELENIADRITDLSKPIRPTPPKAGVPTAPKPGPKPGTNINNRQNYVVRRGDTLASIAKKFKRSRVRLYKVNRKVIERAAREHGRKNSGGGKRIYPGTRLVIPKKL